ncbi:MAG: DUF21 domain-containing protein, partial [Phycisphaerae bacterium]|nr:DUF21 domain-containing protein [Phycisphaerae bacterium]
MTLATVLLIVGAVLAVLASGLFSGSEMGVYSLSNVRVRVEAERGDHSARRLLNLVRHYEHLVITTLVGTNIADYLATVCITLLLIRSSRDGHNAEFYATLIATPAILVFGNIVPKERFRRHNYALMRAFSMPLLIFTEAVRATGLLWALSRLSRTLLAWIDPTQANSQRELLPRSRAIELLREGAEQGGLSPFQRDTFERVMRLSRTPVGRVMVPRQRTACIPDSLSRDDLLRIARMAHFSRLPVYRGQQRNVIGIVHVFDILTDDERRPISAHLREAL